MKTAWKIAVLLLSASVATGVTPRESRSNYPPSEILVKFRETATEEQIATLEQDFALSPTKRFDNIHVCHYLLPVGLAVPEAVDLLSVDDCVEFAEPNYTRILSGYDSPHPRQWYLNNTGQEVNGHGIGSSGNDINWTNAISTFTGTNPVIVAVVDTGIARNHEDLSANVWTDPSEAAGAFGYDFVNHDSQPYDDYGHGTLVAGIIGGVANNGRGIVGICPRAKLMAVKAFDEQGRGTVLEVISALDYARRKGATIINCSFGGDSFSASEQAAFAAIRDAGILVVCAAGNGGADGTGDNNDLAPFYPASYNFANMINVAASDRTLALASFSNYGTNSVQVAAPGVDIYGPDVPRLEIFHDDLQTSASQWISGGTALRYRWQVLTSAGNGYLSDGSWSSQHGDAELYDPWTDSWAQSPLISLSDYGECLLSFSAAYDLADGDDVWMEMSDDAANWFRLGSLSGRSSVLNWGQVNCSLSLADGLPVFPAAYLRFRLQSDGSHQGSGISIDNISITRISEALEDESRNYRFNDGTSFAAPVVTGVAALALAQRRDLTYAEVRNLILSNTRSVPALKGKVSTQGVVDAGKVMTALPSFPIGILSPVIVVDPKGQTVRSGAGVTFDVRAVGPATLSYQWLFEGQPIAAATGAGYTIAAAQSSQAGDYKVVVSNPYGSVTSATATLVVTGGSSADGVVGATFNYQIVADNNPTGYSASGLPPGLRCDVSSGLISGIPTQAGSFQVRVEARNIFGAVSATIPISIANGTITSETGGEGVVGAPFVYLIGADNEPTGYSASGLPPGLWCDTSSGVISGTPTQAGTFWVHVEARSIFGSASATVAISISPGSISSASSADGIVGVPFIYEIAADNNPTGYSASGLPPGLRCDTSSGLILGTPTGAGTFWVWVEAKSIFGSASASIPMTISGGTITSAAVEGVLGTAFHYKLRANNSPIEYSASGLPPGLLLDGKTGVISGTPIQTGDFSVHAEAKSSVGSVSATIPITINGGAIISPSSADGVIGMPFNYQIVANNSPDGYSASGLPPGLQCALRSGIISGVPAQLGTFWVRLQATNAQSLASATIPVTIGTGAASGPPLTISLIGDNLLLTWPATATGFVLQEKQVLGSTWGDSSAPILIQDNKNTALVPLPTTAKYYRLRN